MKRGIHLALSAGLMIFISCGNKNTFDKNAPLPEPKVPVVASEPHWKSYNDPDEIVWYVNFEWFSVDTGNDVITQELERLTGNKIHFRSGNDDTLNQMIASGELPDLITVPNNATQFTKSANRWAVSLYDLADKYDPYFYEVANPMTLRWYTLDDGHVYGYPNFSNAPNHFEEGFLTAQERLVVRKDLYEALGSPDLRTPEGFIQALRDARAYDPTIIPFTAENLKNGGGILEALLSYLAIPKIVDGKYQERLYDDEYLRWMEMFRQAYAEGLIPDDEFTNDWNRYEENALSSRYFIIFSDSIGGLNGTFTRLNNTRPREIYMAVDGPSNRNFDTPTLSQNGLTGWTSTYITKDAKDKERLISFITFMLSHEGQELLEFGIEGETFYRDENGRYQLTPEVLAIRQNDFDRYGREYSFGGNWLLQHDELRAKYAQDADTSVAQINAWSQGKAYPYLLLEDTDPEPRSEEARILTNYRNDRQAVVVNMIRAKSNEEMLAILEQFRVSMDKMGWPKVEKVINENIAKNAKRLGM